MSGYHITLIFEDITSNSNHRREIALNVIAQGKSLQVLSGKR